MKLSDLTKLIIGGCFHHRLHRAGCYKNRAGGGFLCCRSRCHNLHRERVGKAERNRQDNKTARGEMRTPGYLTAGAYIAADDLWPLQSKIWQHSR